VQAFAVAGVDILELGIPFSDPLADGVVNQLAADRALRSNTHLKGILRMVSQVRKKKCNLPLVLFTYFNPIHAYGLKSFVRDASKAGVDGVLTLDLPPEEAGDYVQLLQASRLHPIFLIAPTTDSKRITKIASVASGFIYYVSREGVTGMQKKIAGGVEVKIRDIQRQTQTPVVVGFGISTPDQVRNAAFIADGCVVGSAIVDRMGKLEDKPGMVRKVAKFVSHLTAPLK
jgi:tryptophan synthase alpha chain